MFPSMKVPLILAAGFSVAAFLCPLYGGGTQLAHAQELGFSLNEIQDLLGLRVRHGAACDAVERRTRQKIEVVRQRIRDLQRMKRTLERLAAACAARRPTDDCPILEVLEDHGDISH